MDEYYKELISKIKGKKLKENELNKIKIRLCNKYKLKRIPTDIDIMLHASEEDLKHFKLVTKPTRTLSGVAVVAVMTTPHQCPHGKCIYCPGGPSSEFGDVPQSYTGQEPAAMRGLRNNYDPYLQVFNRLEQYVLLGHNLGKVELIVMGGTFMSLSKAYRETFVMYSFKALNDFSKYFYTNDKLNIKKFREFFEVPTLSFGGDRAFRIKQRVLKLKKRSTLELEQRKNQTSGIRCVTMTLETRPDFGKLAHGNEMLRLGCTKVELGVQTPYEDIIRRIGRGHSVKDSVESTRILKDLGFKIGYHVMPGLPGVTPKKDLKALREYFDNPDFCPDMLKIYPCMVMKGTKLYALWKKNKYHPLTTNKAAELIAEFKRHIPPYCRINRVQRDIPTKATEAGVDRTNLRQYVEKIMIDKGTHCNCIRCREVGLKVKREKIKVREDQISLKVLEYDASQGKEFFISLEDDKQNLLFGMCRLRFPSEFLRREINKDSALIRELHVYGAATSLQEKGIIQHKGYGKSLIKKAEEICRQNRKKKIVVISGVGVREYYKKIGYKKQGPYMVKLL